MLRFIFIPLCSLALAAQTASPSAANEPKPGRIEGRVANAMTNEPVRKATVTLISAPQPGQQGQPGQNRAQAGQLAMPQFGGGAGARLAVTTDAEGKFVFDNVSPGQYRLSAEKSGFVRESGTGGGGGMGGMMGAGPIAGGMGGRAMAALGIGATYKVSEGGSTSGVLLKLLPQGVASGKVLDEDGEPFGQVAVMLSEWNYASGTARFQTVGGAQTDELGNFRIANLPPGRYYLSAEKSGGISNGRARGFARQAARSAPIVAGEETFSYARTYYPGVEELEQAQRIDIQAGQEMSGISLALRKRRVFLVSGELSGLNPEGRYMVQLSKSDGVSQSLPEMLMGGGMGSMARVQDGRFTAANVLPGNYTIRVNEVGNRRPRLIARGEVAVSNADVLNAAVAAVSPASIQGRVMIEGQNTLPQDIQAVRLEYRPLDGGMGFGMQPMQINADGSFALTDISPERYGLSLAAERLNMFVKSITFNGVDIRQSGLDLRNGGAGQVSILLSPKVASVNGRVQLADGAEPGTILAYQEPYNPKAYGAKILRASVQTDGSFTLSNLAPGAYKLFAVEEANSKLMNDPEWQAAQASEAVTVELGESATKSVSLRQIRR
jgi:protocatechuate 3,4-dioxygenase beta subunit